MRRAVAILVGAVALALGAGPASAASVTVTVGPGGQMKFSPADVTIHAGDTVDWVWGSDFHSTTSGSPAGRPDGKWDSGVQNEPYSFDHTFAQTGTFPYFCRVHYAEGMVGAVTVIAAAPPTAVFTVATPTPMAGQPVSFDGSASTDPDGSIFSYGWDFGDGSAGSGAQPVHTYALPGTYVVTLTVTDAMGRTASVSHSVTVGSANGDESPVAVFSIAPPSPGAGQAVSFDGTASNDPDGSITSYSWDFGDGSAPASGPQPTHTYALPGPFLVRLTITDSDGQMSVDSRSLTVGPAGSTESATASFSARPRSPVTGERVTLDASGSSDPADSIVAYNWSFADGTPNRTGVVVHHIFKHHGLFAVGLTIMDSSGQTARASVRLEVRRPSRISHVLLETRRHNHFLEIQVTGAGVLRFRLFGSRHKFTLRRAKALRVSVRPPSSVRERLRRVHSISVRARLHFRPSVGSESTATIKLRITERLGWMLDGSPRLHARSGRTQQRYTQRLES